MASPGVPLGKVLAIIEGGRERSASVAAWRARHGLTGALSAPSDVRVPAAQVVELWEVVAREVREVSLPIRVAQRVRVDAYDVYGLALLTSRDVGAALRRAARYFVLAGNTGRLRLVEGPRDARLVHERPGNPPRLGVRCGIECVLAQALHFMRAATGRRVTPKAVSFAHGSPGESPAHADFFGVRPRFGAARNELVLDRALLALELPRVDGALSAFFERHAERMLGTLGEPRDASTASRVREALAADVFEAPPAVEAVARRLGLGARTLRRRLTDEGASFRALRDEALRDRAMELLTRPTLPLVDVAMVLGFSDQTAFQRAFKRWTGETPQAWRRARRA